MPTILIVDDARLNRELLRQQLSRYDYDFAMASNGREAIEALASTSVDLILLDLMMPEMDGFDFLAWRASDPVARRVPVIVNSALDDFESIERALTQDTYDYFTKPLSGRDLATVLPLKIKNAVLAKRLMDEIENRRDQLEREVELAGHYQQLLLPRDLALPGLGVTTFFQPSSGVAGDFFDFVQLDEGATAFIIADVSGHGVMPAMIGSILKVLFARYIENEKSPARLLYRLNHDLFRLTRPEDFVTAVVGIYEAGTRRLVYATAGHPLPYYGLPGEDSVTRLGRESIFLGMFDDPAGFDGYTDEELCVQAGARLLLFTDGLTEAQNGAGEPYGEKRLAASFRDGFGRRLEAHKDLMWSRLRSFMDRDFDDDIALILMEF